MPVPVAHERISSTTSTRIVLREAKRLHRAATSDSLSAALPVLRRILAANAFAKGTLLDLFRARLAVQRKHVLRTLAFEAGHRSWEAYRPTLTGTDAMEFERFEVVEMGYANLNCWFSNETQASNFALSIGGRSVRVGNQAVVLPGKHCSWQGQP